MDAEVEKHEAWRFMPMRHHDLALDSKVYDGLKRTGIILQESDIESKQRTMNTMWNMSNLKMARQPMWHRGRDGQRYLTERHIDGVHIDPEKYDAAQFDTSMAFPLHPDMLHRQMDMVDLLRTAVDRTQSMQDMYRSSEERRHRRRAQA